MTKWEKFFDEKIKEIAKEKIIIDVGGGSPFQKELAKYKDDFKDTDYKSLDYDGSTQPDIVGDIHNLPFADNSIDAIICKSVLQHIPNPHKATEEIFRVLKSQGKCLVCAPFLYPYHGGQDCKDYFRYSKDGVEYLFRNFSKIEICPMRGAFETLTNFLPFQNKFPFNLLKYFSRTLDCIFGKHQSQNQTSGHYIFLVK